MSESDDGGPGRREVAHRLFAAEFDDAEFSYSESDEERAPNYVVTPTGARVNRLFVVGVLTELEQVNDEVLRARIVDPTGPFVVYAGQYQPEALAFLEAATPPLFVAVTGKARTFEPEDGDRVFTSIRPESISEIDAETRDRWVVQAAEQTLDRVGLLAGAKQSGRSGDALRTALAEAGVDESTAAGITLALDYYGTTGDYLQATRDLARNAAEVVTGERGEAGSLSLSPDDGTDDPLPVLADIDLDAPATADAPTPDTGAAVERTASTGSTTSSDAESTESESDARSSETEASPASAGSAGGGTSAAADTDDSATGSSETLGDFDTDESETDDGVGDFDAEFELDEDEREEIEQEYGTDFQSGSEVEEPGEAGIDTPDTDELAEMEADDEGGAPAEDVDLEDAVMDVMTELDDGSGAERAAVRSTVIDRYGAATDEVDDAIQDALMGGRCYEPEDGKLTPI